MAKSKKDRTKTVYIYLLIDPRDGRARYIGQTVQPKIRLREHLYPAKYKLKRGFPFYRKKNMWIRDVLLDGAEPEMKIVFSCSYQAAKEIEPMMMSALISEGYDLVNKKMGV